MNHRKTCGKYSMQNNNKQLVSLVIANGLVSEQGIDHGSRIVLMLIPAILWELWKWD